MHAHVTCHPAAMLHSLHSSWNHSNTHTVRRASLLFALKCWAGATHCVLCIRSDFFLRIARTITIVTAKQTVTTQSVCWAIQYWTEWVLHLEWLLAAKWNSNCVRSFSDWNVFLANQRILHSSEEIQSNLKQRLALTAINQVGNVLCRVWNGGVVFTQLNWTNIHIQNGNSLNTRNSNIVSATSFRRFDDDTAFKSKSFLENSSQNSLDGMYDIYSPFHNNYYPISSSRNYHLK